MSRIVNYNPDHRGIGFRPEPLRRERVKRHWNYVENRWVIEMCDGCDERPATVDFEEHSYCDRCMEEISSLRADRALEEDKDSVWTQSQRLLQQAVDAYRQKREGK